MLVIINAQWQIGIDGSIWELPGKWFVSEGHLNANANTFVLSPNRPAQKLKLTVLRYAQSVGCTEYWPLCFEIVDPFGESSIDCWILRLGKEYFPMFDMIGRFDNQIHWCPHIIIALLMQIPNAFEIYTNLRLKNLATPLFQVVNAWVAVVNRALSFDIAHSEWMYLFESVKWISKHPTKWYCGCLGLCTLPMRRDLRY